LDKLPMLDTAFSGHEAGDWHIVRGVDGAHIRPQTAADLINESLIAGIAAANPVATAGPNVPDG
jgi:hypothetical protein